MLEAEEKMLPITDWTVDPKNGLVNSLCTQRGEFAITTAGCEIGNWLGFFSQQELAGVRCTIERQRIVIENAALISLFEITLPRARLALELRDSLEQGVWLRHYTARALEPSWLGDFVVRLGVSLNDWQTAGSGSRRSQHRGWNRYSQYPVRSVVLEAPRLKLESSIETWNDLGRLDTLSYWRDDPNGNWIVHHRQLVNKNDLDHVVGRFRRETKNSLESKWLSLPIIWRPLWAFNERWISKLPNIRMPTFQTQGVIEMKKGQTLSLKVRAVLAAE